MKLRRMSLPVALVAVTLMTVAGPRSAFAVVTRGWVAVDGPTGPGDALNAVAAISSTDVWAVGNDLQVEHWDGSAWSVVAVPAPSGKVTSALNAVGGSASNDVWALGWWQGDSGPVHTLAEHWNGAAWKIVPSRTPHVGGDQFTSVAVFSRINAWAIGHDYNGSTLSEHWDGTAWKVVSTPNANPNGQNILYAVAGASPHNLWAVGDWTNKAGVIETLVEHWNGAAWTIVKAPSPDPVVNSLGGVTVIAPNDVWAVGYDGLGDEQIDGLALHWNGSKWTQVGMPTPPGMNVPRLASVAASSPHSVWAAGWGVGPGYQNVIEHWNGTAWSVWPAPNPSFPVWDVLNGVTALPSGDAWAVGASGATSDPFAPTTLHFEDGVVGTSSLSIEPLAEIQLGQSLEISGTLLFSQGASPTESTVRISRTDPDGSTTSLGTVSVDPYGRFSLPDTPPMAGTVTFEAAIDGDRFHEGSSASAEVQVDPATPG
jgi:hypothetical protein